MSPETEWRMWRQLRGAYGIGWFNFVPCEETMMAVNAGHYDNMQDALNVSAGQKVFFEPTGLDPLSAIPNDGSDLVLIFGNTEESNLTFVQPGDLSVQIPSANPVDLYGVNAAAIALAYLHGL